MKTFLLMVEVKDKDANEVCNILGELLENSEEAMGTLTAYQMYDEDEMIPDIMKREG